MFMLAEALKVFTQVSEGGSRARNTWLPPSLDSGWWTNGYTSKWDHCRLARYFSRREHLPTVLAISQINLLLAFRFFWGSNIGSVGQLS
jgi:hypothetical protein